MDELKQRRGNVIADDEIHIACAPDHRYVMPTGVMMISLCENNRSEKEIAFHIVSADLSEEDKSQLTSIADKYGRHITFYTVNNEQFADFQTGTKYPISICYRLFLGTILPEHITKVIYLDGDIIVKDSLRPMWETDMEGTAIAAGPDNSNNDCSAINRLRYAPSLGYFCSGSLLINLSYWREHNVESEFIAYAREQGSKLQHYCDQDILNYVFRERKKQLHIRYNLMSNFLRRPEHRTGLSWEYDEQIAEAIAHPCIIHYAIPLKPWYVECDHPLRGYWLHYKALSPWADQPLQHKVPRKMRTYMAIRDFFIRIFAVLGIFHPVPPVREWAIEDITTRSTQIISNE